MSMINLRRYIETQGSAKIRVEGFYTGRAIKNGAVMREFGCAVPVPNLITNLGMNSLGTSPSFTRMHLGTGTATPAFTDTALGVFGVNVQAASGDSSTGNSGSSPYYGWQRLTWTSVVGGATGNWTEIGISNQNTTGNLRSRALILDGGGLPTTFPVLSDEQFQGTYELRLYVPETDSLSSVTLSGTPHDTVTRARQAAAAVWAPAIGLASPLFRVSAASGGPFMYTGGLSAITASAPLGSLLSGAGSISSIAYVSDSFQLDSGATFASGSAVGAGQTASMGLNSGALQVQYTPSINKLTTEQVILNQRVIWARA